MAGEVKGLLLGSVGLGVSARAHCPVIVVWGDSAGLAGTHERILLGIGDSDDTSTEAVRYAFREAEVRGCVLDVVHAWRRPAFDKNGDRRTGASRRRPGCGPAAPGGPSPRSIDRRRLVPWNRERKQVEPPRVSRSGS